MTNVSTVLGINTARASIDSTVKVGRKSDEVRAQFAVSFYSAVRNAEKGADGILSYDKYRAELETKGLHISKGALSNAYHAGEMLYRCGTAATMDLAVKVILPLPDLSNADKRKAGGIGPDSDPCLTGSALVAMLETIDIAKLRAEKKAKLSTSQSGQDGRPNDGADKSEDGDKRPASVTDKLSDIVTRLTNVTRALDTADAPLIDAHAQLLRVIVGEAQKALDTHERHVAVNAANDAAAAAARDAAAAAAAEGETPLDADSAENPARVPAPRKRAARKVAASK